VPSPKDTYVTGKGFTSPFDNVPAVFTIHAVDEKGKPLKEGGDSFDVAIRDPSGELLPPTIEDDGDGTYKVTYHPQYPGHYDTDISFKGHSIQGFPAQVHVREGTEGVASAFGTFSFSVVARDKRNDVKTFGGDPFEVINYLLSLS
jgi:Filamin/ABP280 repeat